MSMGMRSEVDFKVLRPGSSRFFCLRGRGWLVSDYFRLNALCDAWERTRGIPAVELLRFVLNDKSGWMDFLHRIYPELTVI